MNTLILNAWHLCNRETCQMHTHIYECLYFKAIAINLYIFNASPPKSVIAIAQIGKACAKEQIHKGNKPIIAHTAEEGDIVAATTFEETRTFCKIIARQ